MRKRLLILPAVVAVTAFVGAANATPVAPPSSYCWQQPGTAAVVTPDAQPALPVASCVDWQAVVDQAYPWAQPFTAPVGVPFGQP